MLGGLAIILVSAIVYVIAYLAFLKKGGLNEVIVVSGRGAVKFITGGADPVSDGATSIRELEARYRANGLKDVTAHYYDDARHELLNETNRDDVTRDVIEWLDRVTG